MAKHFNDMLTEMNSKASPWAKSPADNAFIGLHGVETTPDANGNADPVFKGTVKKDGTRAADARGRKLFDQMQKDLKIAAGGKDADGDTDGDVTKGKRIATNEMVEDLEEDVKDIDYARRLFHEAMGRHHDQNAFKCRERGDHAQAKKFDRMSEESFEKATKGAPIKEETESYEEVLAEAESYYNDKNAPFQTGDHVHHYSSSKYSGRNGTIHKHGVVSKHTGRTAEVHWEDGTKSSHHQTSGKHAGALPKHLSSYDDHRIKHNETSRYRADGSYGGTERLTNDKHKELISARHAAKEAAYAHERSHRDAQEKLSSMHHSSMKPHHLKAIHDILDRAKNGED